MTTVTAGATKLAVKVMEGMHEEESLKTTSENRHRVSLEAG